MVALDRHQPPRAGRPSPQPKPNPQPPTTEQAARILNEAWQDPDWAVLIWLTMVTGFRRGELRTLREEVTRRGKLLERHGAAKVTRKLATSTSPSMVLARLAELNPAEYEDWTFHDLAAALGAYDIEPAKFEGVKIVRADDVAQALTECDETGDKKPGT